MVLVEQIWKASCQKSSVYISSPLAKFLSVPNCGRGDAGALGDWVDAAERADDLRRLPRRVPRDELGARAPLVRRHARGRGPGHQRDDVAERRAVHHRGCFERPIFGLFEGPFSVADFQSMATESGKRNKPELQHSKMRACAMPPIRFGVVEDTQGFTASFCQRRIFCSLRFHLL